MTKKCGILLKYLILYKKNLNLTYYISIKILKKWHSRVKFNRINKKDDG